MTDGYHRNSLHPSRGISLVEVVVSAGIIAILSAILVVAMPAARHSQNIVQDTEVIRSWLDDARRMALNRDRSGNDCESAMSSNEEKKKRCDNVGIAFRNTNNQIEIVLFADTGGSGQDGDRQFVETGANSDHVIRRTTLASERIIEDADEWQAFVFQPNPPEVISYYNGGVMSPASNESFTLESGRHQKNFSIHPYGRFEVE